MARSTQRRSATLVVALLTIGMIAAACTPPTPPTVRSYQFKSTQVTVNEANDCIPLPIFGCTDDTDEPYVLNVSFRVKVGEPGSAQTWVSGSRSNNASVSQGSTAALTGSKQNATTFNNVSTLDIQHLATNKLEVVGTYSWAMEKDTIGVGLAADGTANVLKDALNATVAAEGGSFNPEDILDLLFDNLLDAIGILVNQIPSFGLGDDAIGGGFYLGIGAEGTLATTLRNALAGFTIPDFNVPLDLPPDVQNIGVFVLDGATTTFSGQLFDGSCLIPQCGKHTYTFQANQLP